MLQPVRKESKAQLRIFARIQFLSGGLQLEVTESDYDRLWLLILYSVFGS